MNEPRGAEAGHCTSCLSWGCPGPDYHLCSRRWWTNGESRASRVCRVYCLEVENIDNPRWGLGLVVVVDEARGVKGIESDAAGCCVGRKDIPYSGEQAATWSAMQGSVGSLGVVWRGLVSTLDARRSTLDEGQAQAQARDNCPIRAGTRY